MPSSPDDFRDEIEAQAEEAAEHSQQAAPEPMPADAAPPDELAEMADMAQTAQEDVADSSAPAEPPASEAEVPPDSDPAPPVPPQDEVPPELGTMAGMASTAAADVPPVTSEPPPEVAALAGMEAAARQDLPPERTQQEQIAASEPDRAQGLFDMDVGPFEADNVGLDWVQAETAYRETDYAWKRAMTLLVIDHQHRIEQLLSMLERER